MRRLLILAALLIPGPWACGLDVSSPVPQPVPHLLRQSTPSGARVSKLVLGLPGAVAGAGKVHGLVRDTGASAVAAAAAAGSFALTLAAAEQHTIELRFETDKGISEPVLLPPPRASFGPILREPEGPGVVSAPDAGGQVTVTNDGGPGQPPLLQASPDHDLFVSNQRTGEVASTRTDAAGLFRVLIAARTGDSLSLLLVDPDDPGATSDFLSLTVP